MITLCIDLETYSSADLSKCGVYKYTEAPDFEILLFGFRIDGGEIQVVDFTAGEQLPPEVLSALANDNIIKLAHNSAFERICLSRWLGLPTGEYLDPQSWRCTMVWSAYMGLPLSLEGVSTVLSSEKQKLSEGKDLIRYFCKPCNTTKANGYRTRNLPCHDPDKWAHFKEYNKRDVEAELAIQERLVNFPVPEAVWDEYHLDQKINDRGVGLDTTLVRQAITMDSRSRSELTEAMKNITSMDNPNSVSQMKDWLAENGLETDSLGKKAVADLLKTAPPELQKVLSLRQQLAKSSVKKYTAMENVICSDGRTRGLFQFYGANRTGRAAGRLLQPQNMPGTHMPDLEQARQLVKDGDYDAINMLYDSVPEVLSELIRTAFIPKPGYKFIVSDYASIEAVVLAWLAGEQWTLDAYAAKRDLYIENAEIMFGAPKGSIDKKSPLRQKSKVAVLACIAEGQLVLTDLGLVPIEEITHKHKLWDGESWVEHDGVIYRGEREVIEYEGLIATTDHLVWVEGQSEPIQFGIAAACKAHLIQTGDGGRTIRLGKDYKPRKAVDRRQNDTMLCPNTVPWMWSNTVDASKQFDSGCISGMSKLFSAKANTNMARQEINSGKTTVRKSKRCKLSSLWCKRNKVRFYECNRSGIVPDRYIWLAEQEDGTRQDRQQWRLHEGQYPFYHSFGEQLKQTLHSAVTVGARVLAVCLHSRYSKTIRRADSGQNYSRRGDSCVRKAEELANHQRTARLYDIRNAGRHHRFTVSGKLVHNCGYQGSVGALKAFGALDMGLKEEELKPLVDAWRTANPNIVKFWWEADRAALKAVSDRTTAEARGIRFSYQSGMLFITLPSGRRLAYVKPRISENRFGMKCVTYEGVGTAKKWERIESSPGKWVENITQAVARDILYNAINTLRCCSIVMHIHDEIVIEADISMSLQAVCEQMIKTPPWAKGLPLRADGYETNFYKKG